MGTIAIIALFFGGFILFMMMMKQPKAPSPAASTYAAAAAAETQAQRLKKEKEEKEAGSKPTGAGCWLANPTPCPNGYPHPGYKWYDPTAGSSSPAACEKRKSETNAACGVTDTVTDTRMVYNPP